MPGLDVNFYAGVLPSSTEETILPTPWSHLNRSSEKKEHGSVQR